MKRMTISLSNEIYLRLDQLAKEKGISPNTLVIKAIIEYLEKGDLI